MDNAQCAALRPTGELVFAGVSGGFSNFAMTVGQITASGTLDTSFGTDGITTFSSEGGSSFAYDIVVLDDGKVLLGGAVSLTAANTAMAVWRLTADGALDPTFADNGALVVDIDESEDYGQSLFIDASGNITLAGTSRQPDNALYRASFIRCDETGTLVNEFGNAGVVVYPENTEVNCDIRTGLQTPSGEMYLAGYTTVSWESQPILMGFDADGLPLEGFGDAGLHITGVEGRYFDLAFASGSLIAVGDGNNGSSGVVRAHDLTGALDLNFGTEGTVLVSGGPANGLMATAVQPDGRIVVGGSATMAFMARDFLIARLNPDGSFDTSWGDGGVTVTEVGPGFEDINDLAIQPDGKVIATGFAQFSNNDYVFARYGGGETGVVLGCIDADACNYNPDATADDGSCYSPGDACDDGNPETANDVYDENCDCVGESTSRVVDFVVPFSINAFPNPATDQLTIQRSGSLGGPCRLRLLNSSGSTLLDETIRGTETTWDLSDVARGIYLITATTAAGDWTMKLMLQ